MYVILPLALITVAFFVVMGNLYGFLFSSTNTGQNHFGFISSLYLLWRFYSSSRSLDSLSDTYFLRYEYSEYSKECWRHTSAQLNQAHGLMVSLIENLQAGLLVESHSGMIITLNQRFGDLYDASEFPLLFEGTQCEARFEQLKVHYADPAEFMRFRHECLTGSGSSVIKGKLLERTDGRVYEHDYVPIIIDDEQNQQTYRRHLWSFRDVTEYKNVEMQLKEKSEKLKQAAVQEHIHGELLRLGLQPPAMKEYLTRCLETLFDTVDYS